MNNSYHLQNTNIHTETELQCPNHYRSSINPERQDPKHNVFHRTPTNINLEDEDNSSLQPPQKKISFLSLLHFAFAVKLIRFINSLKGSNVTEEHLKSLVSSRKCQNLEDLFTLYYYELRVFHPGKYKLIALVLYRIFKKDFLTQIIWQILFICSRILVPYFLYLSLISVRNPALPISDAYPSSVGMFLCLILGNYSSHQFNYSAAVACNGMKVGLLGMIFRKMTKISLLSLQKLSFGKAINVVATDANNLENIHYIFFLLLAPLSFGGAIGVQCYIWGPSALVGIGYMIVIWVLEKVLSDLMFFPGKVRSFYADERIRKINEVLEAIRVVKMQTWESYLIDAIRKIRTDEIKTLKKITFVISILRAFTYSSQYIAAFLILLVYSETNDLDLTSVQIYPSILLLAHLRQLAMIFGQVGFVHIVLMKSLFLRIMSIMDLPEANPPKEVLSPLSTENILEFHNFSGYWTKKDMGPPPFFKLPTKTTPPAVASKTEVSPYPALSSINIKIKKGDLVAVIGQTGSGKSSLLMSFTREMIKTEGELRYSGKFEYMSQEPMILASTVRDSITFGRPYDEELFWTVVEACCLMDIMEGLPNKEFSEIGERGVNLSSSQKAQIALARVLYSRADIYLLDDPFSNFDPRLSKMIFKKAIQGYLKGFTVIVVTNSLNFVKFASQVIVLEAGKIIAQGKYSELTNQDERIKLISELKEKTDNINEYDRSCNQMSKRQSEIRDRPTRQEGAIDLGEEDKGLFIESERLDDGIVTYKILKDYLASIFTWWNLIPFAILFLAPEASGWQFMIRTLDWITGEYTDSEAYAILATIAFGALVMNLVKLLLYFNSGLNGSHKLHDKMLDAVIHSPLHFFDRNRVGRILNRFANDIGILDRFLLPAFLDFIEGFCLFMVYLIALWVREPWILIPAGIALTCFIVISIWCNKAINQTRGLELTMRGPLYSLFSVMMNGLTVIRAKDQTEDVMKAFYKRADSFSQANIAYRISIRFMSFLLDYITELTVIGTFCFYIHSKDTDLVNGPFVNMLITLPSTMQWILRNFITFHSLMASPARIINYCQNSTGTEMAKSDDEQVSQSGWPHDGEIDIQNANLRYGEHEKLVIKDLSVNIRPGEKVAVVGYSSFGMTSIVHLLTKTFLVDDRSKSSVKIDGVDIRGIGAPLIRKSMTIISQDFYLFTGTIRENLDPYGNYGDEDIWDVLNVTRMKEVVEELDKKLDTYYIKGCSMFSIGQKELFNVARSILKKRNIVIQDRATRHLDVITDQMVQKNLRERYSNATYLRTTYRLWNVADFDKVLCMKNGVKVEFDEPYRLLVKKVGDKEITNPKGYFARLVLDMSMEIARDIFKAAMIDYYKKHNTNFSHGEVTDHQNQNKTNTKVNEEEDWEEKERERPNTGITTRKTSSRSMLEMMKLNYLY